VRAGVVRSLRDGAGTDRLVCHDRTATVLLLLQIGPSALVGISLFLLLTPVQTRIMGMQFQVRKRSMRFTDGRSRLLQELLGSFAIVKYFTLERPFLDRIGGIRWSELQGIRSILLIKAANQSIAMSLVRAKSPELSQPSPASLTPCILCSLSPPLPPLSPSSATPASEMTCTRAPPMRVERGRLAQADVDLTASSPAIPPRSSQRCPSSSSCASL
jgi:hypothetical protein